MLWFRVQRGQKMQLDIAESQDTDFREWSFVTGTGWGIFICGPKKNSTPPLTARGKVQPPPLAD